MSRKENPFMILSLNHTGDIMEKSTLVPGLKLVLEIVIESHINYTFGIKSRITRLNESGHCTQFGRTVHQYQTTSRSHNRSIQIFFF